ncbi:hypothetical protein [Fodinibius saliphilus]|uniref:hypothetical protein n=1 Tax=Fodinibius saliphilus TaxID=1920650 RepID=UPI0011087EC6|nr:hypothetical protein [Fodinibius saliphilus]
MVTHIFRALILLLLPVTVFGQSLDLSVVPPTTNNSTSTFLLDDSEVVINSTAIRFLESGTTINSYEVLGVSPANTIISVLKRSGEKGQISVYSPDGEKLDEFSSIILGDNDPSIAVYPADNGDVLLRDNIANFTFYGRSGNISDNMSSSSQSKQGEQISEVAISNDQKTMIIYSPKIKRDNNFASQVKLKMANGRFRDIHYSSDRYIKSLELSDDGNVMAVITAKQGSDDQAIIMDRFGNELNTITTDKNLIGASFSADHEFITLYSGGRVMVHNVLSGESLGATSFRSPVFLADYFAEDNLILAVTGNYTTTAGVLSNVEFRGINLKKRSITTEEFGSSVGFLKASDASIERLSADNYQLNGGSKRVRIKADF